MGALAGDHLQHPLSLVPQHASCRRVRHILARHWVVVTLAPVIARRGPLAEVARYGTAAACLAGVRPGFDNGRFAVYAPI
jgi:hypothetical protein